MLLDKGELVNKESTYDLEKISGVSTPSSDESSSLPLELSEGLKEVMASSKPSLEDENDDDSVSKGSEGYLPATLRAAISVSNEPQTAEDKYHVDVFCNSSPLAEKSKKNLRSIRRTKSDNTRTHASKDLDEDVHTKSLLTKSIESSPEDELGRLSKSEELKKTENHKPDTNRRSPITSRREKVKSRRANPRTETLSTDPSKSPSARRSKPRSRLKTTAASSKSLDTTQLDKQVIDWKRTPTKKPEHTPKQSELQSLRPERKPKKSKAAGSNPAAKSRISKSRETRSLSRSRVTRLSKSLPQSIESTKDNKYAVNRKGSSPHQLQRKRSQKQKQVEPEKQKQKPQKRIESINASPPKPKLRRTLRLTSKATTPSCRNLLRKISEMNDNRISKENTSQNDFKKIENIDEKQEPIDELSRSTLSPNYSMAHKLMDLEDTNQSTHASTKPKEENPKIPELLDEPKEENRKTPEPDDQDKKREKPPRTKSAPLRIMLKEKAKVLKTNSSKSLSIMALSLSNASQKKLVKKSFADQFQKFGSSTSRYDIMLSMHGIDEDYNDNECDSDSDGENSFSGEESADVNKDLNVPETSKLAPPPPPGDINNVMGESRDKVMKLKEIKSMKQVKKEKGTKKLSEHVTAKKADECDDILSMAEFSSNSELMGDPTKPQSCLQIDFSELSKHGTGTPRVRAKKLRKRSDKSGQELQTTRGLALKV